MSRVQAPSPTPSFPRNQPLKAGSLSAKISQTPIRTVLMKPMSCRGVLFDMDGVLVDSTAVVARVWSVWARKHGLDADAVVKIAHGRPSISTIRELLPKSDQEAEDREVERLE